MFKKIIAWLLSWLRPWSKRAANHTVGHGLPWWQAVVQQEYTSPLDAPVNAGRDPHCGTRPAIKTATKADIAPQCGSRPPLLHKSKEAHAQRDQAALAMLDACAELFNTGEQASSARNAEELAGLFFDVLQTQPELQDYWLDSQWVKSIYPAFVRWAWVGGSPPSHKAFASALAEMTNRWRIEHILGGRRVAQTMYFVHAPSRGETEKRNAPGSIEPRASTN